MHLDVGIVTLGAGEPPCYDVIRRPIALVRGHNFQRFPRGIETSETQGGRSEVQLAVEIARLEARNLGPPRHCLWPILFFAGLSQDLKGRERIMMDLENGARRPGRALKILLCQER